MSRNSQMASFKQESSAFDSFDMDDDGTISTVSDWEFLLSSSHSSGQTANNNHVEFNNDDDNNNNNNNRTILTAACYWITMPDVPHGPTATTNNNNNNNNNYNHVEDSTNQPILEALVCLNEPATTTEIQSPFLLAPFYALGSQEAIDFISTNTGFGNQAAVDESSSLSMSSWALSESFLHLQEEKSLNNDDARTLIVEQHGDDDDDDDDDQDYNDNGSITYVSGDQGSLNFEGNNDIQLDCGADDDDITTMDEADQNNGEGCNCMSRQTDCSDDITAAVSTLVTRTEFFDSNGTVSDSQASIFPDSVYNNEGHVTENQHDDHGQHSTVMPRAVYLKKNPDRAVLYQAQDSMHVTLSNRSSNNNNSTNNNHNAKDDDVDDDDDDNGCCKQNAVGAFRISQNRDNSNNYYCCHDEQDHDDDSSDMESSHGGVVTVMGFLAEEEEEVAGRVEEDNNGGGNTIASTENPPDEEVLILQGPMEAIPLASVSLAPPEFVVLGTAQTIPDAETTPTTTTTLTMDGISVATPIDLTRSQSPKWWQQQQQYL